MTTSRVPFSQDAGIFRASDSPRPSYQVATADPVDDTTDPVNWERPFLYTQIPTDGGRTLHVINLHMKSRIASSIRGQKPDRFTWKSVSAWVEGSFISSMKRMGQALQVRIFIDQLFDEHGDDALIALCGDFNAETDEVPVMAICGHVEETGNPDHAGRVLVLCENNIPDSARYSLLHLGRGEMIDHIIVSRVLLAFFVMWIYIMKPCLTNRVVFGLMSNFRNPTTQPLSRNSRSTPEGRPLPEACLTPRSSYTYI